MFYSERIWQDKAYGHFKAENGESDKKVLEEYLKKILNSQNEYAIANIVTDNKNVFTVVKNKFKAKCLP